MAFTIATYGKKWRDDSAPFEQPQIHRRTQSDNEQAATPTHEGLASPRRPDYGSSHPRETRRAALPISRFLVTISLPSVSNVCLGGRDATSLHKENCVRIDQDEYFKRLAPSLFGVWLYSTVGRLWILAQAAITSTQCGWTWLALPTPT